MLELFAVGMEAASFFCTERSRNKKDIAESPQACPQGMNDRHKK